MELDKELEVEKVEALETQPEVETADVEKVVEAEGEEAEVKPEEKYQPNFKYKAAEQEKEFDDRLKSIIKSKQDEDWLREVMSKADGFDAAKELREQKLAKAHEKYEALDHNYRQLEQSVRPVVEMLEKKDYANAFEVLGISDQDIIKYAYQRVRYSELTPEQRQSYDNQKSTQLNQYELQRQNESYQAQLTEIQTQQRQAELNNALSQPEVSEIVRSFDQRNGAGSFFQEVAKRGAVYWQTQNIDKKPQELVSEIINSYGLAPQKLQSQSTPEVQKTFQQQKEKPPVIPNTGSSGSGTPIKRKPKSIADLREYAKTLAD